MNDRVAPGPADIQQILARLPHRYPFLLVDRVLSCEAGKEITALKNVTINEPFFNGHFPGHPVMPGVLMLEALAQTSLLLGLTSSDDTRDVIFYLVGIDQVRFKRPVVPGDQLVLKSKLLAARKSLWKFAAEAWVGDELAASAELMAAPRRIGETGAA
ncbi:MAG: 3-hydroxyacyl-ACP dehydratase FabZ [Nevskiales bacterium]